MASLWNWVDSLHTSLPHPGPRQHLSGGSPSGWTSPRPETIRSWARISALTHASSDCPLPARAIKLSCPCLSAPQPHCAHVPLCHAGSAPPSRVAEGPSERTAPRGGRTKGSGPDSLCRERRGWERQCHVVLEGGGRREEARVQPAWGQGSREGSAGLQ